MLRKTRLSVAVDTFRRPDSGRNQGINIIRVCLGCGRKAGMSNRNENSFHFFYLRLYKWIYIIYRNENGSNNSISFKLEPIIIIIIKLFRIHLSRSQPL